MRFLRLDRKCDARILTGERRLPVKLEMGHKRTFALQHTMSALPPIADIRRRRRNVGPLADLALVLLGLRF
jgi:hypothetical protein